MLRHAGSVLLAAALVSCLEGQGYPRWTFTTPSTTADAFGGAVAFVGDENGDGVAEVLVGARSWQSPFLPSPVTYAVVLSGADATVFHAYTGISATDAFGAAVANAGDLDGDGVSDFVISAPGSTSNAAGVIRVYSGGSGALLYTITGSPNGDQLGASLAGGADYDLDGVPDIVAGAPGPPNPGTGLVIVFSGLTGAPIRTLSTGGSSRLGASVANAGDVDGDGFPDVLAGAPGFVTPLTLLTGSAYVFSGATGATIRQMNGAVVGALFGSSVAGIGDVDGDSVPDFAIGAPYVAPVSAPYLPGRVEVRSGLTSALLLALNGTVPSDQFGASIADAGDLDGDGRRDFVVGVPHASTGGYTYNGAAVAYSSATGAPLFFFAGTLSSANLGAAVAGAMDATGDGVPDVAAGAPGTVTNGNPGSVKLCSPVGTAAGLVRYGTSCLGTAGFAPSIAAWGGSPAVGNAGFGIAVTRALAGAPAYLFFSGSQPAQGVPIGGGCFAWLGAPFFQFGAPITLAGPAGAAGAGHGFIPTPVPANPGLVGAAFFLEWAMLDAGSAIGVSVSDALALTIQ